MLVAETIWNLNMRKTEKLGLVSSFLLLGRYVFILI